MTVRGFTEETRSNYIRGVRAFAAFIRRSPDTATAEDLRRFQLHQTQSGIQPPSINSAVSALRFFFTVTLDRPDLARRLTVVRQPRRLPVVLSVEEIALLLQAAPGPKYKAAFATVGACPGEGRGRRAARLRSGGAQGRRYRHRAHAAAGIVSHDDARAGRVHPALLAPHSAQGVPSHSPLRAARQRRLEDQYRARQRTDRHTRAVDRSAGRRRGRPDRQRPQSAMPLLRRPHDHRRDLRARQRTPPRHQNCDAMTTVTAPSYHLPAGDAGCRPRIAVVPTLPNADCILLIMPKSPRQSRKASACSR